jgi:hypothetical protein
MKLNEIKKRVSSLPTIMRLSDELQTINELMSIDTNEILEDKDTFCSIVRQVELSHTDSGFIEITKENEDAFINFYHWLCIIKVELNLELNDNTIENFNFTPDEVERLMSKLL